jgi:hypothetical protein
MDDGVGLSRVEEDLHMTSAPMSCDQELTACKIPPIRHRAHLIGSEAVNPTNSRHGQ